MLYSIHHMMFELFYNNCAFDVKTIRFATYVSFHKVTKICKPQGVNFGMSFIICPFFVYMSSKDSDKTANIVQKADELAY